MNLSKLELSYPRPHMFLQKSFYTQATEHHWTFRQTANHTCALIVFCAHEDIINYFFKLQSLHSSSGHFLSNTNLRSYKLLTIVAGRSLFTKLFLSVVCGIRDNFYFFLVWYGTNMRVFHKHSLPLSLPISPLWDAPPLSLCQSSLPVVLLLPDLALFLLSSFLASF